MPGLEQEQKKGDWQTVCPYCEEEITGDTKEEVVEKEARHRANHFNDQDQDPECNTDSVLKTGRNILDEYSSVTEGEDELDLDPGETHFLYSRTGFIHRQREGDDTRVECGASTENLEKVSDVQRLHPALVRKCSKCFPGRSDTR